MRYKEGVGTDIVKPNQEALAPMLTVSSVDKGLEVRSSLSHDVSFS